MNFKRNTDSVAFYYALATVNVWLICAVGVNAGSKTGVKAKGDFEEDNYGVKYASKCEVCRVVTKEVEHQLNSNFNSPEIIQTGYNNLQDKQKKISYGKSMIRLQEALESTCRSIMSEYNIHKERTDWTRFDRGQSQTFSTLHGLSNTREIPERDKGKKGRRNKGVKVDLGMPEEMWDKPSAEITQLKSQCDSFLEDNEEKIEKWYKQETPQPLDQYLCKKALRKKDQECLADDPPKKPNKGNTEL